MASSDQAGDDTARGLVLGSMMMSTNNYNNNRIREPIISSEEEEEVVLLKNDDDHSHQSYNFAGNKKRNKEGEKTIVKKPKYAFQTRSQVDILDDGYRWRKYGQKAVKNNNFPRSYYRCTRQGCNVKKQVQRLSKDEGIVVTTYEGVHSHPIEKSTDNFEHILTQMQIYTTTSSSSS